MESMKEQPAENDFENFLSSIRTTLRHREDFPITEMSRCIAEYLWTFCTKIPDAPPKALDVGTGSGVHALLLAHKGHQVHAIDINEDAVQHTKHRLAQYFPSHAPNISVVVKDLRSLAESAETYDIVVFNPPAYRPYRGHEPQTSASSGVYLANGRNLVLDLVKLLPRLLNIGGSFVAAWPGLPRFLVENDECEPAAPVQLIEQWIGHQIFGDSPTHPDKFFHRKCVISSDYGLGSAFYRDLFIGFRDGFYSKNYAFPSDPQSGGFPSFRFGILHLTRPASDRFELKDSWSKGDQ